jgi:hypothetical protein
MQLILTGLKSGVIIPPTDILKYKVCPEAVPREDGRFYAMGLGLA